MGHSDEAGSAVRSVALRPRIQPRNIVRGCDIVTGLPRYPYSYFVTRLLKSIGRTIVGAIARRTPRVVRMIVHYYGAPRRHELSQGGVWTSEPESALAAQGLVVSASHREAASQLLRRLHARIAETDISYPDYYGVADTTVTMIAMIAVLDDVRSVTETGVADGRTSFVLLDALSRRKGRLCSIDIASDVGGFVVDRTGWDLRITDGSPAAVRRVVDGLGQLDLFIHDSDHSYVPQLADLEIGWDALRPGGWLVADDADWSYACLDFVTKTGVSPSFLYNERNVVMVTRKPLRSR